MTICGSPHKSAKDFAIPSYVETRDILWARLRRSETEHPTRRSPEARSLPAGMAVWLSAPPTTRYRVGSWHLVRSGAAGFGRRRRYIERGVAVEEPDWFEPERDLVDGHDRPLLGPGDVVDAEYVPEHDVGVLD